METEDPRVSIQAKDVKTRAAAARDLARIGTLDDLPLLVKLATGDKSSAVRLYTAGAAADVLSRHRGVSAQPALDPEWIERVHAWVRATDPGHNPGLLMMLSALPDRAAIDRLGRVLKDPRNGVRAGAATALRRMALSSAKLEDASLRGAVAGWFSDKKTPADALLELIKLTGEAGWVELGDAARAAAGAGRPHVEASEEALRRLALRTDPAGWEGLWRSDGLDVGEVNATPRAASWRIVVGHTLAGPSGVAPLLVQAGRGLAATSPWRIVWAPRPGEPEPHQALQDPDATFWLMAGKDLPSAIDEIGDALHGLPPGVLRAVAGWLGALETAAAERARAVLLWRAGDKVESLGILEELSTHKKPRSDVWYWLGVLRADTGDAPGARAALDEFLDKAAKKAAYRKEAEKLRKKLCQE